MNLREQNDKHKERIHCNYSTPLLIGIVGGLLIGVDWMFDNHPELLGVIMILIAWAVWSIIIYNRDEDYG